MRHKQTGIAILNLSLAFDNNFIKIVLLALILFDYMLVRTDD